MSSRLDYWLISSHLLYDLDSTEIYPAIKTDHSLIQISFILKEGTERGRGLWKLNNSLLNGENRALVLDAKKCEIKCITISYSIAQSKQQQNNINYLKLQHKELKLKLDNNYNVIESYSTTKNELEKYDEEILHGTIKHPELNG